MRATKSEETDLETGRGLRADGAVKEKAASILEKGASCSRAGGGETLGGRGHWREGGFDTRGGEEDQEEGGAHLGLPAALGGVVPERPQALEVPARIR